MSWWSVEEVHEEMITPFSSAKIALNVILQLALMNGTHGQCEK